MFRSQVSREFLAFAFSLSFDLQSGKCYWLWPIVLLLFCIPLFSFSEGLELFEFFFLFTDSLSTDYRPSR